MEKLHQPGKEAVKRAGGFGWLAPEAGIAATPAAECIFHQASPVAGNHPGVNIQA